MKAKDDESLEALDAEFDLAFEGDAVRITVHARGGAAASGSQTNPGYEALMQLLLERLKFGGCNLEELRLASKTVVHLSASQRRIQLREFSLPLHLRALADVTGLRHAILRALRTTHSRSKVARNGNATKRIELVASCPMPAADMVEILEWGASNRPGRHAPSEMSSQMAALEGGRVLRTHLHRERNQTLVAKAKATFQEHHGRLFCEVCGFDFKASYGELGADFIEAHHETPIAERDEATETRLQDLRMVCANCHRMLHRAAESGLMKCEVLRHVLRLKSPD